MIYIGIDPGASGGIALLSNEGAPLKTHKMPGTERDLLDILTGIGTTRAVLERVWSSPQMGVASAFKFGANIGMLRMALVAARIPFDEILPTKWQTALGCQVGRSRATGGAPGGDKNITKRRAQALFPGLTVTHAIADALLLAEFCRRIHRGSESARS
jgi:hypothetical protein